MNTTRKTTLSALALSGAALIACVPSAAEDIDIFVGSSAGTAGNPNVLIVLDNTSNWARQSQQWPGGLQQGQSEANAIKTVLQSLGTDVNIGLMEYVTGGNANDNGGFVRHAIQPLSTAAKASLSTKLTTIYGNINSPDEKRNSNTPYGNLMYDVYNYYAGANSYSPGGVLASIADSDGYTTNYSKFKSPLSSANTCSKTYVIFIGNPNASGPSSDDTANTAALKALGGDASQLGLPVFGVGNTTTTANVGTTQCYANATAAAAELSSFSTQCSTYTEGCSIGSVNATAGPFACPTGTQSYSVIQSVYTPPQTVQSGQTATGNPVTTSASTTNYYSSASAVNPTSDHGTLTCPSSTTSTSGNTTTKTTYSCTYSVGAQVGSDSTTTTTGTTNSCYNVINGTAVGTGSGQWNPATSSDHGSLSCPVNSICTYDGTTQSNSVGCGNNRLVNIVQTATLKHQYTITQTATPTVVSNTTTTIPAYTTTTNLGYTSQCYSSAPTSTSDYTSQCTGTNTSCSYSSPTKSTLSSCPAGTYAYNVVGTNTVLTNVDTGTTSVDNNPLNADEWARFMFQKGIPTSGSDTNTFVSTYTIDVYNKQPNATHTALMMSMAKNSGGKYFAATDEAGIVTALQTILVEIQAKNSSFASVSLPVNATNRTQNENQVFIGTFRPDPNAKPRWFGNMKRYQVINKGGSLELGDNTPSGPIIATSNVTGFFADCAISFWTSDSGSYWQYVTDGSQLLDTATTVGKCPGQSAYSDSPDGPLVEKGGIAEVIRKGNNPPSTNTSPTWEVNRNIQTLSGSSLTAFTSASSGLSTSLVDFILGKDVNNEKNDNATTKTRPSVHGDVIHSRPLPINYGSTVLVYYGSNDGTLRSIDADTGKEKWAFIAPEFFSRLARLKDDSPLVSFSTESAPGSTAKDYFFDGSLGFYQSADNSKLWIFPTMRRGGRMIYAFDVKDPETPAFKWKLGCPNLTDDIGCTSGMESIGQTWSTPRGARIKGYSTTDPVLIVGGGYDSCEDNNTASPSCASAKGGVVYIIDADKGTVITSFTTSRSVAADVSLVDVDGDGYVDYAYAADTGGNIHRIDFVDTDGKTPLTYANWKKTTVAHVATGSGRKFLFGPALYVNSGQVYMALGSGDREHPLATHYPYTTDVLNRFYVYRDKPTVSDVNTDLDSMTDYTSGTTCDTEPLLPTSTAKGWFISLNQYGKDEQTVSAALIAGGTAYFNTNRPITSANSCSSALGQAAGYAVNLFNASGILGSGGTCGGSRRSVYAGGGLPPTPVLATAKVNGRYETFTFGTPPSVSSPAPDPTKPNDGDGVGSPLSPNKPPLKLDSKRHRAYTKISTPN